MNSSKVFARKSSTLTKSELPTHLGLDLSLAYQAWQRRFIESMRAEGVGWLTPGRATLVGYIPRDGCRQAELLEKTAYSKQALQQQLDALERAEVIRRDVDPADKRGRIIRFTENGLAGLHIGDQLKSRLEAEFASLVGSTEIAELRRRLQRFAEAVRSTDNDASMD